MQYRLFVLFFALSIIGSSQSFAVEAGALDLDARETNKVYGPDIQLTKDWKIVPQASSNHKPLEAALQTYESTDCEYKRLSETEIQLGTHCEFLSGVFRYIFQPEGAPVRHQVIVGFTVSRPKPDSRIFMVSSPLETLEKKP